MLKRIGIALALFAFGTQAVLAQSSVLPYFYNASNAKTPVGTNSPLPITGSISASLAPFTPGLSGARGTPLTVTTSDSSGNLPTNTGSVIVYNVGSNPMYCNVNAIAATVADQYISASGGWFNFGIPSGITTLRCIATGGSTTANTAGGSGLGAGTGGGSGGGGGGAVTIADNADVTQGALADAASSAGGTGSLSAKLRLVTTQLNTLNTTLGSPFQAGGALAANQSVNVNQINSVTPLMGNGATGTGSQRITIANDNTIPTGWPTAANQTAASAARGEGATGATVPSGSVYMGLNVAGNLTGWTAKAGNTYSSTDVVPGIAVVNTNANGQATMANSSPVVIASNQASIPVAATLGAETTKNIGTVSQLPYPSGATPYTATATGTTGATTATLAGASSVTTYLCGFSIRANATAAATGNATVTGVITATLNFTQWTAPNASGIGVTEMVFNPCIPASGTNQSVAVVSAAPGTGGVVSVTAWGYKL